MWRLTPIALARLALPLALGAAFLTSAPARADDGAVAVTPPVRHVTLVQGGGFVTGGPAYSVPLFGSASTYRLDAGLEPNLDGGYTAGLGATIGVPQGQLGSDYTLRIGRSSTGDWFSVNPFSRLGVTEVASPASDMALSFTYSRAILPGLSLTGTAEAYRPAGPNILDPVGGGGHLVIGAGLGIRF